MSGSINKCILIGRLGNDPEIRTFGNGGKVANLSIATSESWRDKSSGEKREKTEWHKVTIFNDGLVGVVERYVKKGSKVYIEGKLQTRKWEDLDGNDKYVTEVVLQGFGGTLMLLDGREGVSSGNRDQSQRINSNYDNGRSQGGHDDTDEIPF